MSIVGLLAPVEPLAAEYDRVLRACGCEVETVVTPALDSHTLDDVTAAGDEAVLVPAARQLGAAGSAAVAWACTSGSFAGGLDAARDQVAALASAARVPATSTSLALLDALAALGTDSVGVCSPYPWPVTERLCAFLDDAGIGIAGLRVVPTDGPSVSKRLDARRLSQEIAALGAVPLAVVPDTAIPGCDLARDIDAAVPVLFANQWTIWRSALLAGGDPRPAELGPLAGVAP